jgi:hypothetical protein
MRAICCVVILAAACGSSAVFECQTSNQCGAGGVCEAVGYCSFLDATCAQTGRRFGEFAAPDLAGQCVGGSGPGSDAGADAGADAGGTTMSFGADSDTFIDSSAPTQNGGSATDLRTDASPLRFAMMHFDVSSIPSSATVVSATLTVWTTTAGALTMGSTEIYRLLESWNEDKADWNHRNPGMMWTTAGAQAPGSRDATASAEFTPSANDTMYQVVLPAALVQGWVSAPATNDGIVFVNKNTPDLSVMLVSKEGSASKRPQLQVTYQP